MDKKFTILRQPEKREPLQEMIRHAVQHSPMYRDKYRHVPEDAGENMDFLPLLSREDYYKGMKPPHFPIMAGKLEDCYIFTSGGTTGDVKLTAWSQDFVKNWTQECFESLSAVGLEAGDRVINLFFPGIWATHTLINKALEKANCRIIPLGGKVSLPMLVTYLKRFEVTTLIGVPSFMVRLTEYIGTLPQREQRGIHIKKIFHAGEFLSPRQSEFIRERLHCHISPFIYSSTDTGTIGMKCPHCETNQYHVADTIWVEIPEPEEEFFSSGTEPQGICGELVVTSLKNYKAPCIRYRVGDRGIIHHHTCPCGNPAPLLTLKGRADDEVKVAGYLISPETVRQGLEQFPQLSRNFQLIITEEQQKALLTVACEVLPGQINTEPNDIATALMAHYDILAVLVKQGYCLPIQVQLLQPGSIPRNVQTGKFKQVRDLR